MITALLFVFVVIAVLFAAQKAHKNHPIKQKKKVTQGHHDIGPALAALHELRNPEGCTQDLATPPMLTLDMIDPPGERIDANKAVKLFKLYMLTTKAMDAETLRHEANSFAANLHAQEDHLRAAVARAQASRDLSVMGLKFRIKELREQKKGTKNHEEKQDLQRKIFDLEDHLTQSDDELLEAKAELRGYRRDKRFFLVDYINNHPATQRK